MPPPDHPDAPDRPDALAAEPPRTGRPGGAPPAGPPLTARPESRAAPPFVPGTTVYPARHPPDPLLGRVDSASSTSAGLDDGPRTG